VLKFIDLFAGIGGMRLAFERQGMECVFSSEWDQFSKKTYKANFDEEPAGDITKIAAEDVPSFDVLLAGFPCQPFSSIGKRQGFHHPTQGTLFYDVVRFIQHHKPSAFLLENVKGLVNHDSGRTWKIIQDTLDELGYDVKSKVLDAADYGVPQHRERIYIVGFRRDLNVAENFGFPDKEPKQVSIGKFVESGIEDRSISVSLQQRYLFKIQDGRPEIITPKTTGTVKTLVASYHKIQRLTGTFVADGPTGVRLLSESECKAIMGFPRDFKVPVSRTQMYRQFGNSVAVPVVEKIAKQINAALTRP
jgi:DNA (cytosine-5)-methyltransferase 1